MSELKAHRFLDSDEVFPGWNFGIDYYLKSEVDKAISEKDKEIRKLKEQVALLQAEFIPEPGVQ